jgi:glutathione S-transferase
MITVHHLNNSRSQRVLWMLEELAVAYEIVFHQRDAVTNLAPSELKAVHPLGKSPVIVDGDRVIAESGAILDYLARWHGGGALSAAIDAPEWPAYLHWMHFAEGSAMLPLMLHLYTMRLGDAAAPVQPRIAAEIDNHLGYMDAALAGKSFLLGDRLTAADIQNSFVLEAARTFGKLGAYDNLSRALDAWQARPAYQRALEKGGPYAFGPQSR